MDEGYLPRGEPAVIQILTLGYPGAICQYPAMNPEKSVMTASPVIMFTSWEGSQVKVVIFKG